MPRRHVASKEGPRQQDREKNRLLQQAGDEVQYTVWPGPQEPRTVCETVAKDGTCDTKGDQKLNELVLLIIVATVEHVAELHVDVDDGEDGVCDEE